MDSDDTIEPQRVEKQFQFMEKYPNISLVGTWIDHIDEKGNQIEKAHPFPATHEEIKASFRTHNSIGGATSCWRKEALIQVGGFHLDYLYCEDFALNMAFLAEGYRVANIQEVLYHYRMHPTQVTRVHRKLMYENTNRMYAHYGPLIWGKDAPDFKIGLSLPHRIVRKLKKLISV
jgi:GT2 family glycosyltransferase